MRKIFVEIFGCALLVGLPVSPSFGATLEKEKIELERAESKLREQVAYVHALQEEIARKEIERIQQEVIAIFHQDVTKNLNFGLSSSDSEEFTQQILGFLDEVNGQRPFTSPKSTRGASKLPEDEGEKPKAQVITHLSNRDWLALFREQREILSQIIHNHPPLREGAQLVLDEILMLITEMSDLEETHDHPPSFYSSK